MNAEFEQKAETLAGEFAGVLASLPSQEIEAAMSRFWLSVAARLHDLKPGTDINHWSRLHRKTPVPAELIRAALLDSDESVIKELEDIRRTGGHKFEEFIGDLELIVRSPEPSS